MSGTAQHKTILHGLGTTESSTGGLLVYAVGVSLESRVGIVLPECETPSQPMRLADLGRTTKIRESAVYNWVAHQTRVPLFGERASSVKLHLHWPGHRRNLPDTLPPLSVHSNGRFVIKLVPTPDDLADCRFLFSRDELDDFLNLPSVDDSVHNRDALRACFNGLQKESKSLLIATPKAGGSSGTFVFLTPDAFLSRLISS